MASDLFVQVFMFGLSITIDNFVSSIPRLYSKQNHDGVRFGHNNVFIFVFELRFVGKCSY